MYVEWKILETKDSVPFVFKDSVPFVFPFVLAWAIAKGLPTAPVDLSTTQYYQLLCNTVERMANKKERETTRGYV